MNDCYACECDVVAHTCDRVVLTGAEAERLMAVLSWPWKPVIDQNATLREIWTLREMLKRKLREPR